MKLYHFILFVAAIFVGCKEIAEPIIDTILGISHLTCPDPIALNYNYIDCNPESSIYNPADCGTDTSSCTYCEDVYATEEEMYANCCNISGAENYDPELMWIQDNTSRDLTYCIFDTATVDIKTGDIP